MGTPTHVVVNTASGTVYACPEGSRDLFQTGADAIADAHTRNAGAVDRYRTFAVYKLDLVQLGPADEPAYLLDSGVAGSEGPRMVGLYEASHTLDTLERNLHELQPGEHITLTRLVQVQP